MYVVQKDDGWTVKQNKKQVSRIYKDKDNAIRWARSKGVPIMIKGSDGRFHSYQKKSPKAGKLPDQHVIPHKGKWAVRCENCLKNTAVFNNRTDALMRAERIANNYRTKVFVHRDDGTFEDMRKPRYVDPKKQQGSFWNFFKF